jgi:hypothetical protein
VARRFVSRPDRSVPDHCPGAERRTAARRVVVSGRSRSRRWSEALDDGEGLRREADPLSDEPAHRQRQDGRQRDPKQGRE